MANYYRAFGWNAGGTVIAEAQSGEAELGPVARGGNQTSCDRGGAAAARVSSFPAPVDETAEATVFSVETENGHKLYLGFNNFYVITRYNRSVNYAMAVWELATEIKAALQAR